jgi:phosphate transport system substrate-binding protein
MLISSHADHKVIKGAGGSLGAPLYYTLAYYYQTQSRVQIKYDSIGSFGAIEQVKNHLVDFIVIDKPLTPSFLKTYDLIQFPSYFGSVAVVYNVENNNTLPLKLDSAVLSNIFLGTITYWDDPFIKKLNPTLALPHQKIVPVYRKDESGTSFNFTSYLSKSNQIWQEQLGIRKSLNISHGIGVKGSNEMADTIKQTPFSIGYVENAYRLRDGLPSAFLKSQSEDWVNASTEYFYNAIVGKNLDDFSKLITFTDSPKSYPIMVPGFTVIPRKILQNNELIDLFFQWVIFNADEHIEKLGYTSLPYEIKLRAYDYIINHKNEFKE